MALGDACTYTYAIKDTKLQMPNKKPAMASTSKPNPPKKSDEKKQEYGAWGPTFKNKEHFTNMHFC